MFCDVMCYVLCVMLIQAATERSEGLPARIRFLENQLTETRKSANKAKANLEKELASLSLKLVADRARLEKQVEVLTEHQDRQLADSESNPDSEGLKARIRLLQYDLEESRSKCASLTLAHREYELKLANKPPLVRLSLSLSFLLSFFLSVHHP